MKNSNKRMKPMGYMAPRVSQKIVIKVSIMLMGRIVQSPGGLWCPKYIKKKHDKILNPKLRKKKKTVY